MGHNSKHGNPQYSNSVALQDELHMSYISKHQGQQTVQQQSSYCKIYIRILPFLNLQHVNLRKYKTLARMGVVNSAA